MQMTIIALAVVAIAVAFVILVIRLHKTLDEIDKVVRNANSVVADVRTAKDTFKFGALSGILKISKLISRIGGERA